MFYFHRLFSSLGICRPHSVPHSFNSFRITNLTVPSILKYILYSVDISILPHHFTTISLKNCDHLGAELDESSYTESKNPHQIYIRRSSTIKTMILLFYVLLSPVNPSDSTRPPVTSSSYVAGLEFYRYSSSHMNIQCSISGRFIACA